MILPASPRTVVRTLAAIVLFFGVVHTIALLVEYSAGDDDYFQHLRLGQVRRQLHLESEANLTTWYSSATLLVCSYLLYTIAWHRRRERDRFTTHWMLLALVFVFLSIDETAMLHEATIMPLHAMLHPSGIFVYAWVIPAIPLVAAFAFINFRFVMSLPPLTRVQFVVAGAVYVGGALGLEMAEGAIASSLGDKSLVMLFARGLEEILEMTGLLLFIRALLEYMVVHVPASLEAWSSSQSTPSGFPADLSARGYGRRAPWWMRAHRRPVPTGHRRSLG